MLSLEKASKKINTTDKTEASGSKYETIIL